jgi:predicted fused transcriptional regulator/phosphomethylpyrimidine kinase
MKKNLKSRRRKTYILNYYSFCYKLFELISMSQNLTNEDAKNIILPLQLAIKRLEECKEFGKLIPEVGSNMVYARQDAKTLDGVAGLTGRIIKVKNQAVAVGDVEFGWSKYMSSVILTALTIDRNTRTAISLKNNEKIVLACRSLGLELIEFGDKAPESYVAAKCVTPFALLTLKKVPGGIYDHGDIGIEPLIILFGTEPITLAQTVCKVAKAVED